MRVIADHLAALRWRLSEPVDAASLAAFRVGFGLLLSGSSLRFLAHGWVDKYFVEPRFFFHYLGFEWVRPLPSAGMHGAVLLLAVLGLLVALGLFTRAAAALFCVVFTYVHLVDATNYLNHYYLITILTGLIAVLPLDRFFALDALRRPESRTDYAPAWVLWLLRFQLILVYLFAAVAKAGPDWLVHGQPLGIWLSARTDVPLVGPLLANPSVAIAASWAGFLHDALVVPLLLLRWTRALAFCAAVGFHAATGLLFDIGIFPVVMIVSITLLLSPSWPRRWLRRPAPSRLGMNQPDARPLRTVGLVALCAWAIVQVAVPLRAFAYGGEVLWHEQGMRFAWKVMVREKNGSVVFRVRDPLAGREWLVPPRRYLTRHQEREVAGQPDLILQLAHRIAEDARRQAGTSVEVRADALVSLNGRRPQRLVDADVNLARVRDGIAPTSWILPAPEGPPPRLRAAVLGSLRRSDGGT